MGEMRIVGPGKTHRYPYPVCKKIHSLKLADYLLVRLADYLPVLSRVVIQSRRKVVGSKADFSIRRLGNSLSTQQYIGIE